MSSNNKITNLDKVKSKLIKKILKMNAKTFESVFGDFDYDIISTCPKLNKEACPHEDDSFYDCTKCSLKWLQKEVE